MSDERPVPPHVRVQTSLENRGYVGDKTLEKRIQFKPRYREFVERAVHRTSLETAVDIDYALVEHAPRWSRTTQPEQHLQHSKEYYVPRHRSVVVQWEAMNIYQEEHSRPGIRISSAPGLYRVLAYPKIFSYENGTQNIARDKAMSTLRDKSCYPAFWKAFKRDELVKSLEDELSQPILDDETGLKPVYNTFVEPSLLPCLERIGGEDGPSKWDRSRICDKCGVHIARPLVSDSYSETG